MFDQTPGPTNVLRVGDTVVLSRRSVVWYRRHLGFLFSQPPNRRGDREFTDDSLEDIVFWYHCYKHHISPVGTVTGFGMSNEEGDDNKKDVRVSFIGFGHCYETIVSESQVIRIASPGL
jgi:hypothetical protein